MTTTIVSCYYLLPNNKKRSIPDYITWISNFLTYCHTPIVMFSDGEIADAMDSLRKTAFPNAKNWLLIRRPLDQLTYSSPEYLDYFTKLVNNIPRGITTDVVKVWMNKIPFLKEVAEKNTFNTNSFLWCDAGCWRNQDIAKQYGPGWPRTPPLSLAMTFFHGTLQAVRQLNSPKLLSDFVKEYSPVIMNNASVAGAIFGGPVESIKLLDETFLQVLHILMESNIYKDGDQEILAFSALWLESQGLPVAFYNKDSQPVPEGTDEWFLFQTVL